MSLLRNNNPPHPSALPQSHFGITEQPDWTSETAFTCHTHAESRGDELPRTARQGAHLSGQSFGLWLDFRAMGTDRANLPNKTQQASPTFGRTNSHHSLALAPKPSRRLRAGTPSPPVSSQQTEHLSRYASEQASLRAGGARGAQHAKSTREDRTERPPPASPPR